MRTLGVVPADRQDHQAQADHQVLADHQDPQAELVA